MNLQEAYQILGVAYGAPEDEVKSAFKKLALQHHPDRNKDNQEESEKKFKEINSAYQLIQKGENTDPIFNSESWPGPGGFGVWSSDPWGYGNYSATPRGTTPGNANFDFFDLNEIFNSIATPQPPIHLKITFAEATLGCIKDITFKHQLPCNKCMGKSVEIKRGQFCQECSGTGRISNKYSNMVVTTTCPVCRGMGFDQVPCSVCSGTGLGSQEEVSQQVRIPYGAKDQDLLSVGAIGDFDVKTQRYKQVRIALEVEPDPDMHLEGIDVISQLEVSLLEALKGTIKSVRTLQGEMKLKVAAGIKNGQIIKVGGAGAGKIGSHIFNVKVNYPEDSQTLIDFLETQTKEK